MRNTVVKGQKISVDCSGFFRGLQVSHSPQAPGHHPEKGETSASILGEMSPSSGSYLWLIITKLIQSMCFCIPEAPSAQTTKCNHDLPMSKGTSIDLSTVQTHYRLQFKCHIAQTHLLTQQNSALLAHTKSQHTLPAPNLKKTNQKQNWEVATPTYCCLNNTSFKSRAQGTLWKNIALCWKSFL